jgi:hypothetical protein
VKSIERCQEYMNELRPTNPDALFKGNTTDVRSLDNQRGNIDILFHRLA